MASQVPMQSVFTAHSSCLRLTRHQSKTSLPSLCLSSTRSFTSSPPTRQPVSVADSEKASRPRWQATPPRMKMPVPVRERPQGVFKVNEDPRKLDEALESFLGEKAAVLTLSEEVKWLAVTHKSFDHGRRGFNDRLAYLGKRILDLETSLALLRAPVMNVERRTRDDYDRDVAFYPKLSSLVNLTDEYKGHILDKARLASLARNHKLHHVTRWKPRKHQNPLGSGSESVLTQTVLAIIGALALERGGHVATAVVRRQILEALGL